MTWDFVTIRNRKRKAIPVVRFGNEIKRYKSLNKAAKMNNTYANKIHAHIKLQKELNGYLFDYQ